MNILFICIFFIASKRNSARGKAVSSNGKFATINGLKLYYEELSELLTTKKSLLHNNDVEKINKIFR